MTDINTIADRYAALKAEGDAIAKQLANLRDEILSDGAELYKGDRAWLLISLVADSTRLDSEIAKKYLTPEQIAFSSKVVKGTARITIKAPF